MPACCAYGTHASGPAGSSSPLHRASPTTPTMVRRGRVGSAWAWPTHSDWPIGSWPGKKRRASASLITTTGRLPAVSVASKVRPALVGTPSASA